MPSENSRAAQRLLDIIENIDKARAFISGMSKDDFLSDDKTAYATLRALEIISEASKSLPSDLKARNSTIPWQDINSAGNIYRHEYLKVSNDTVWETVATHLPELRAVALQELRYLGYGHLAEKP
jgi:uncharacterized protein with HEPN domain